MSEKKEKRLAHDITYTYATSTNYVHAIHKMTALTAMLFATFKHRFKFFFFNKLDYELTEKLL